MECEAFISFLKYVFNRILDIFKDTIERDEEINPKPKPSYKIDPKVEPKFRLS